MLEISRGRLATPSTRFRGCKLLQTQAFTDKYVLSYRLAELGQHQRVRWGLLSEVLAKPIFERAPPRHKNFIIELDISERLRQDVQVELLFRVTLNISEIWSFFLKNTTFGGALGR